MAAFTLPYGEEGGLGQIALPNAHWEALTAETLQAFHRVAGLPFVGDYYLAGGTGLALHLGHRFSVDLDFFSSASDAVGVEVRTELRGTLEDPTLSIVHDEDGTFSATWRGVGISFFRLHLYPLVEKPFLVEGVPVASLAEIGAMKLAAIMGRGTRKDLVDLYYVLQEVPIEDLFQVASVKYARVRTFAVSATRALAYFDDAEGLPMPTMIDSTPWAEMKRFLESQAMAAGRKRLEDLWD